MQRSRHTTDESEKGISLLEATPETLALKLQLQDELDREREAATLSARRAFACRVVAVGFGILFLMLFCFKALSESADQRRSFSSACMHAVGGGIVGPRGSLLHFDARCTEELKEYFDQAYYAEVRRVSDEAIAYFRQLIARQQQQDSAETAPANRGTVVFDIDETALSNMDGFFEAGSLTRLFSRESPDRCVRPHLEYDNLEPLRLQLIGQTGQLAPVQPQRRPLCYAPPLRATLDLYNFLYDNNFTVIFLTGRSDDARSETEANLADAGYGKKCSPVAVATIMSSGTAGSFGSAVRHRSLRQYRSGGVAENYATATKPVADNNLSPHDAENANASRASAAEVSTSTSTSSASSAPSSSSSSSHMSGLPFAGLFSPPSSPPQRCYTELLMREAGDERLASVFKAEARARLVEVGHVLVGNIGDQFSDLVGQASAVANFKLPNPVYTLL